MGGVRLIADGRQLRAVLFDVDGTLVDSIPFLVECFQYATRVALGRTVAAVDVLPMVGIPLVEMFARVEPHLDHAKLDRCMSAYRDIYLPAAGARSELFPDARAVLEELRASGLLLGIVSGKSSQGVRRLLEPAGLLDRFGAVIGADHGGNGKPAPDGALAAAALLGIPAAEAVVVGDSLLDIEMGCAAGAATVGVATGTTSRAELEARATVAIDRLSELPGLFEPL